MHSKNVSQIWVNECRFKKQSSYTEHLIVLCFLSQLVSATVTAGVWTAAFVSTVETWRQEHTVRAACLVTMATQPTEGGVTVSVKVPGFKPAFILVRLQMRWYICDEKVVNQIPNTPENAAKSSLLYFYPLEVFNLPLQRFYVWRIHPQPSNQQFTTL